MSIQAGPEAWGKNLMIPKNTFPKVIKNNLVQAKKKRNKVDFSTAMHGRRKGQGMVEKKASGGRKVQGAAVAESELHKSSILFPRYILNLLPCTGCSARQRSVPNRVDA